MFQAPKWELFTYVEGQRFGLLVMFKILGFSKIRKHPESPSTHYWRTLVPNTKGMGFRTGDLKY